MSVQEKAEEFKPTAETNGTREASERLFDEVQDQGSDNHDEQQAAVQQLEEEGVLPALSLEFLNETGFDSNNEEQSNFQIIDSLNGNEDGIITEEELTVAQGYYAAEHDRNPVITAVLANLSENYETVSMADGEAGISQADVDAALANDPLNAQRLTDVHTAAEALTNDQEFFDLLDDETRGNQDQNISRDDLERVVNQSGISTEYREMAQTLLDHWDSQEVRAIRDGGDGDITDESLAAGDTQLDTQFNALDSESETPGGGSGITTTQVGSATVTSQGALTTEIAYADGTVRDFGYQAQAPYELISFKDADGVVYERASGTEPWMNVETGEAAPFEEVSVEGATVTFTNADGATLTVDSEGEVSGEPGTEGEMPPADDSMTEEQYQQAIDVLAASPELAASIVDENGVIQPELVENALYGVEVAAQSGDPGAAEYYAALNTVLAASQENPGLTLDQLTMNAYGESETFEHRQAMESNAPLTPEERAEVEDYLAQHPEFRERITDDDGNITRDTLAAAGQEIFMAGEHGAPSPYTEEELAILGTLNDSYNILASADGNIRPAAINPEDGTEEFAMPAEVPAEMEMMITVQAGDGFDRIAVRAYMEATGNANLGPQEIIALSQLIASLNGNDRSYSGGQIHPDQQLTIPDLSSPEAQAAMQNGTFLQWLQSYPVPEPMPMAA